MFLSDKNKGYGSNLSANCFNKLFLLNVSFSQNIAFPASNRSTTAHVNMHLLHHYDVTLFCGAHQSVPLPRRAVIKRGWRRWPPGGGSTFVVALMADQSFPCAHTSMGMLLSGSNKQAKAPRRWKGALREFPRVSFGPALYFQGWLYSRQAGNAQKQGPPGGGGREVFSWPGK